ALFACFACRPENKTVKLTEILVVRSFVLHLTIELLRIVFSAVGLCMHICSKTTKTDDRKNFSEKPSYQNRKHTQQAVTKMQRKDLQDEMRISEQPRMNYFEYDDFSKKFPC